MEEWIFSITGKSVSETELVAKVRDFEVVVDEPEEIGGTNKGPSPLEYLLIALAGCLNITLRGITEEKKIKISDIEFTLNGIINPEKFQGISDKERAGYKEIRIMISCRADASEEEIKELIKEIESRCPVTDNIRNSTLISIEFKKI